MRRLIFVALLFASAGTLAQGSLTVATCHIEPFVFEEMASSPPSASNDGKKLQTRAVRRSALAASSKLLKDVKYLSFADPLGIPM